MGLELDATKNAKANETVVTAHRGNWSNQAEFFLSCLGYAVGLGNVWRFPYLCYKNGGGAFLIPYTTMLAFCALPIFFVELALGQYHGTGPNILFKHMAPAFRGLGYAMILVTFYVNIYYNDILGWVLYYTYHSFSAQLPWEFCGNEWNSIDCFHIGQNDKCKEMNQTFWNNTCTNVRTFCDAVPDLKYFNYTHCFNGTSNSTVTVEKAIRHVSPSEDFFINNALVASSGFSDYGEIQGHLVLCLFLAWVIVAACLVKGVKSAGKVVYFTALFPYVVLFILLIRGATLDGAWGGIVFYIVPKWSKLLEPVVWIDAATQIFYSLGPAFGSLLTLASYNKFNNNCLRDAIAVSVANCATSVFAGFVIFSIVGFMAHTLDVPVDQVVRSGQGLAFVAYPEAVTKMPLSQLWSVLFFTMLITLGLDSQFSMSETLITAVHDQWPKLRPYSSGITIVTCIFSFLLGLPLCCNGGIYLFTLIDSYSASWSILLICLCEFALVSWVYGVRRFSDDLESMLGIRPNWYWKICWVAVSPILILGILIFTFSSHTKASFGDYEFSDEADGFGWAMASSSVLLIPLFTIYEAYKVHKRGESFWTLWKPTKEWGPAAAAPEEISTDMAMEPPRDKLKMGIDNGVFQQEP